MLAIEYSELKSVVLGQECFRNKMILAAECGLNIGIYRYCAK